MKQITKIEPSTVRSLTAKIRVAAYCRVSTEMDDQLVSLEAQKSHYENLINANPEWRFVGLYYDEGISGTSKEKRPALLQMIADCEAGKIDRILTKSLSRFARNTTDCLELTRKLLDLGVTIYFEKENLDTGTMESELLLSIMSSLAANESVSISENYKWGNKHRFASGTFKISYAPYGYDVEDGEFSINEDEAKWVRWIFTQAINGATCWEIARHLNEKQVPSRRNGNWTASTIQGILTNEKYIGDCLFQKTYSDFRFKRHKNYGEQDQFYVEDHHEPIISKEDFESVRALLQQGAKEEIIPKGDSRFQNRYPFTSKLICSECGSIFKRHINSTGDLRYPVWVCKKHLADAESCSMKYIRECDLEFAFTTMMNKLIFAREGILKSLVGALRVQQHNGNRLRIDQINSILEENTERRKTLTTIMTQGYLEPAFYMKEANDLTREADAMIEEKERLLKEVTGKTRETGALGELIQYVAHAKPNPSFDGELARRFLDHVTVQERNEIIFHLKCGLNLTERIGEQ